MEIPRYKPALFGAFVALWCGAFLGGSVAVAQPESAQAILLECGGTVELRAAGTASWEPVAAGRFLSKFDRIRTYGGSECSLLLPDLRVVYISQNDSFVAGVDAMKPESYATPWLAIQSLGRGGTLDLDAVSEALDSVRGNAGIEVGRLNNALLSDKDLALSWLGGMGPFHVRILNEKGLEVWAADTEDRSMQIGRKESPLKQGQSYTFEISQANGETAKGTVEVLGLGNRRSVEAQLRAFAEEPEFGALRRAAPRCADLQEALFLAQLGLVMDAQARFAGAVEASGDNVLFRLIHWAALYSPEVQQTTIAAAAEE